MYKLCHVILSLLPFLPFSSLCILFYILSYSSLLYILFPSLSALSSTSSISFFPSVLISFSPPFLVSHPSLSSSFSFFLSHLILPSSSYPSSLLLSFHPSLLSFLPFPPYLYHCLAILTLTCQSCVLRTGKLTWCACRSWCYRQEPQSPPPPWIWWTTRHTSTSGPSNPQTSPLPFLPSCSLTQVPTLSLLWLNLKFLFGLLFRHNGYLSYVLHLTCLIVTSQSLHIYYVDNLCTLQ